MKKKAISAVFQSDMSFMPFSAFYSHTSEENHQRMGKTKDRKQLSEFQGRYLQPFRNSHRKAVYVSEETQRKLDFVVRKIGEQGASVSGYVEQVLREHLDQYKDDVERWRKL